MILGHPTISPLPGYQIAEQDTGSTQYYGYLRKDSYWYIMRVTRVGSVRSYRFVKGRSGFPAKFVARATLTYGYFDEVFG